MFTRICCCACLFWLSVTGFAESPGADWGAQLRAQQEDIVRSEKMVGASHLVVIDGKESYFHAMGYSDFEKEKPFRRDTIVRIYSMTKPITSVTAMVLWEQGKFKLDDPVGKFLPAFQQTKVLAKQNGQRTLADAKRPITVRDVFRHTTGYGYNGMGLPEFQTHYEAAGMLYRAPVGTLPPDMELKVAMKRLADIPAFHHPGEFFTYGYSTDLLGRLIEVWSGKTLDQCMDQLVFSPLQMMDTGFVVPAEKVNRFASCHSMGDKGIAVLDRSESSEYTTGFAFLSGGGGLVSTIDDYSRFCQMLVGGGTLEGQQILQPETVRLMFTNQLSEVPGDFEFGLGFAIKRISLGSGGTARTVPEYSWAGYASTDFRLVPEEKMVQIFFRQLVPSKHDQAARSFRFVYSNL